MYKAHSRPKVHAKLDAKPLKGPAEFLAEAQDRAAQAKSMSKTMRGGSLRAAVKHLKGK